MAFISSGRLFVRVPRGDGATQLGKAKRRCDRTPAFVTCLAASSSFSTSSRQGGNGTAGGNSGGGKEKDTEEVDEPETAEWRDEVRVLFDRNTPLDARAVLLFDLIKQGPEIAEDLVKDVKEQSGVEGISPVVNQVVTDILPEGPAIASKMMKELPETLPRAVAEMKELTKNGTADLPEMIRQEAANVFKKTPDGLETPDYDVLYTCKEYEVRRYGSFTVAEAPMSDRSTAQGEIEVAEAQMKGFNTLAGYLFGGNESNQSMSMTTPVIIEQQPDGDSTMSFILPSKYNPDNAPAPKSTDVKVRKTQEGQCVASRTFPGFATDGEVKRQLDKLEAALAKNPDVQLAHPEAIGKSYRLLQYNPPYTLPWLRRNEILVPVRYKEEYGASREPSEATTEEDGASGETSEATKEEDGASKEPTEPTNEEM